MKLLSSLLLLGFICSNAAFFVPNKKDTLVLTQVVFRHGDRTPAAPIAYPKWHYPNAAFAPYGIGQLTLKGKRAAYKMGNELLQRYGKFLGNKFYPELLVAISSEHDRSIMSLQSALAALFKPSLKNQISFGLDWQPILYKYINFEDDKILSVNCSLAITNIESKTDAETQIIYDYLSMNLGSTINSPYMALEVQNNVLVLEEMGFKLPEWVKPIWPQPLTRVGQRYWKDLADQRLPVIAGYLLQTLNENMLEKINGTEDKGRKLFLYSGHDLNVVALLGALGVYDGRYINYCAYLSLELHKINEVYGVKAFLQNYEQIKPVQISIPSCGEFCPLNDFISITKANYPRDPWCY